MNNKNYLYISSIIKFIYLINKNVGKEGISSILSKYKFINNLETSEKKLTGKKIRNCQQKLNVKYKENVKND